MPVPFRLVLKELRNLDAWLDQLENIAAASIRLFVSWVQITTVLFVWSMMFIVFHAETGAEVLVFAKDASIGSMILAAACALWVGVVLNSARLRCCFYDRANQRYRIKRVLR